MTRPRVASRAKENGHDIPTKTRLRRSDGQREKQRREKRERNDRKTIDWHDTFWPRFSCLYHFESALPIMTNSEITSVTWLHALHLNPGSILKVPFPVL